MTEHPRHKGILANLSAAIIVGDSFKPIECVLFFDEDSPFEIVFASSQETSDGGPVEWHWSRDVLSQAVHSEKDMVEYGEGDVQMFKAQTFLYTFLAAGQEKCLLAFMLSDMQKFLSETERLVPLGAEPETDWDAAFNEMLDGQ